MTMNPTLKQRIFKILHRSDPDDWLGLVINSFIIILILLNLVIFSLETVKEIEQKYQDIFVWFDSISVLLFTIEYILRVWSCNIKEKFKHPVWGRLQFMLTPLILIDLLAILPFYLPLVFPDLRFFRSIRLFRVLRLLKLSRYSDSLKMLIRVFLIKKEELIITFSVWLVILFFGSTLMYFVEHEAQPKIFANIPISMWWGVVTLTTVGYGDVYPVTAIGKLLASVLAILGVGIFALPAGILASGFAEELQAKRIKKIHIHKPATVCPHCGKPIDEFIHHKSHH